MNFKTLNIDDLEFDKKNPRMPTTVGTKENEIIKYLAAKTGIEDLMVSIGENGFFQGEAIVVAPAENGRYTVLEGNRRLAALRLLQDPDLAGSRRSIAKAASEAKSKPTEIPAYVVSSRDDALQYLGFRHISGVQRWDPLAKARYLKLLYEQASGEPKERYIEIAREIGSKSNAVQRNLDALAAYEVIAKRDFFDIEDLDEESFQFGTFYTAIGDTEIALFVGTRGEDGSSYSIVNPKSIKEDNLKELAEWMFKKDGQGSTRLGESRNIPRLSAVIANPNALEKLRQGVSLDRAYSYTVDNKKEFFRDIVNAIEHLRQANANLDSVSSDDHDAVERVREAQKVLNIAIKHLKAGSQ